MAVIPTGAIFNYLTYGGINSADYGIYITGAGVYNAPARAVELTAVPGRNGAIPIDMGYWENVEVVYPAGCFADNADDFAQNIADFRNAILSQRGYQRLEDTYNPDEFRMALCVSEFEVDPVAMNSAGEFEIKFNCKPQRFLKSGELATAVTSGDDLTNPTRTDAHPLLEIKGYGFVNIDSYTFEIENAVMGETEVLSHYELARYTSTTPEILSAGIYNVGDTLTVDWTASLTLVFSPTRVNAISVTSAPLNATATVNYVGTRAYINYDPHALASFDTSSASDNVSDSFGVRISLIDGTVYNETVTPKITYTKTTNGFYLGIGITTSSFPTPNNQSGGEVVSAVVDSSVSILGNPTYIDCDVGSAYKIVNGNYISLNQHISLGAELPALAPGANSITYDNTITELKVVPRWWQL